MMGMTIPNIVEFATDSQLCGLSISPAQETLLRGVYGLPLVDDEQRELWYHCTGGRPYREGHRFSEVTVVSGARGGKDSRIAAPCLCYEASYGGHDRHLSRGERAVIPLVSADARQNTVARGYVFDYMQQSPLLASLVADVKRDALELTTRTSIVCFPNTAGGLRAWSIPAGGLNEVASWRLEGAVDADVEIQASIRRGMIGFARTLLLKLSTPYMRSGLLHADFERAFGQDDPDLLVWRASSALMNPSLSSSRLAREERLDPLRFKREYLAEWIDDVSGAFVWAWIDAAVNRGRPHELPARGGIVYYATTDPMGAGEDAWPLLIFHVEGAGAEARIVVDLLRSHRRSGAQAPNLEGIAAEYCDLLKRYRCEAVCGDKYAAGWVRQAFERHGIRYEEARCDKSAAYLELVPWLAQGRVELPDHALLVRELRNLERRPRPGGKDLVDHPRGQHDDHANVLALAAVGATQQVAPSRELTIYGGIGMGFHGGGGTSSDALIARLSKEYGELFGAEEAHTWRREDHRGEDHDGDT